MNQTIRQFVVRRLLQVIPAVAGILLTAFILVHIAPGDPIVALAGENGDAAYYADMRQRFGLDQPLDRQLVRYAANILRGNLGFSYVQGQSAAAVIMRSVPATLLLTSSALLLALAVGVPMGALLGRRPHDLRDTVVNVVVLSLSAAPVFLVAQSALLVFALRAGITPVQGMLDAGGNASGIARALDILRHLALPATVLATQEVGVFIRLTRTGVVEQLARGHVQAARGRGVSEGATLLRHALPRALLSVVTVIGARAGHLVAGAAIVEIVFGWPGMGRVMIGALQTRDEPVLLGIFLVVALAVVLANLVTDLVQATIDPRIRLA
jgi:peptide/nickel transport system permease protein